MRRQVSGFTMIELIIVIVIVGILAAVALPRFIDLSSDAKLSALQGLAGSAGSAMTINYTGCSGTAHQHTTAADAAKCRTVNACSDVGNLIQGGLPTGYSASGTIGADNTSTGTCTLSLSGYTPPSPVTFTGMSAGN